MSDLERLADLIRTKSRLESEISAIIQRPALIGHAGEFIASVVFDIELHTSASFKASDGRFRSGSLAGRSVNVKWYARNESLLDIHTSGDCDDYLVLSGPRSNQLTSRGGVRPWLIEAVYLFDCVDLSKSLSSAGVRIGVATSVRRESWEAAEIFPRANNPRLMLCDAQRDQLHLFSARAVST